MTFDCSDVSSYTLTLYLSRGECQKLIYQFFYVNVDMAGPQTHEMLTKDGGKLM